jgi:hypothetical protein
MRGQTARTQEIDVPGLEPRIPSPSETHPPPASPSAPDAGPSPGSASALYLQVAVGLIVLLLLAR